MSEKSVPSERETSYIEHEKSNFYADLKKLTCLSYRRVPRKVKTIKLNFCLKNLFSFKLFREHFVTEICLDF
jgi:hypothetical protein